MIDDPLVESVRACLAQFTEYASLHHFSRYSLHAPGVRGEAVSRKAGRNEETFEGFDESDGDLWGIAFQPADLDTVLAVPDR